MTNLEALKANLSQVHGLVIHDNAFTKALADEEITGTETYVKDNGQAIDLATVRIYRQVLGAPNMQEGDVNYSLTNKEHLETVIDSLLGKWGLDLDFGSRPVIRGVKAW